MTKHEHDPTEFDRLQSQTRVAHVNFLLTELQTGHALLDSVDASRDPAVRGQARDLARQAYDAVARHLASGDQPAIGDAEREEIGKSHARLGARLDAQE